MGRRHHSNHAMRTLAGARAGRYQTGVVGFHVQLQPGVVICTKVERPTIQCGFAMPRSNMLSTRR